MATVAVKLETEDAGFEKSPLGHLTAHRPVRCLLMEADDATRSALHAMAELSQFDLRLREASGVEEAGELLVARDVDVLLIGAVAGTEELMEQLADEARLAGVPVLVFGADISGDDLLVALRTGVSDVLPAAELCTERLDQAVEHALRRVRGPAADQLAMISNLQAENETLRRISVRNMRLLKGQVMPLMSLSWRMLKGEQVGEDDRTRYAKGLARITRNVAGLIDDTVIVAATHRAQDVDSEIDLNELLDDILRDDLGEIANSRAHVVSQRLPVLRARHAQIQMLFEELLLTAVRNGRIGRVPEVEFGSGTDADGNAIIWMVEKGLQLSARKQAVANHGESFDLPRGGQVADVHAWSLCQRLVERNHGQFKISEPAADTSRLMMRFPRRMLVNPNPPQA